jgi:predicted metal-binding protein
MVDEHEQQLLRRATELGVSDARLIDAARIRVEDDLAAICKDPGCPGYGQGANCPPHVMKPEAFRELLRAYPRALVFKFDVPTEVLLGDGRFEVSRIVHETAAALERHALACGYADARGLAAGSCKRIFCAEEMDCRVLSGRRRLPAPGSGPPLHFRAGRQLFRTLAHRRLADPQDYQCKQPG